MGILSFTIRSSLAGGAAYYTVKEGWWGSPDEVTKAYGKMFSAVNPMVEKYIPLDLKDKTPPSLGKLSSSIIGYWNFGVLYSIKFLSELPKHASNGVNMVKEEIEKSNLLKSGETEAKELKQSNS